MSYPDAAIRHDNEVLVRMPQDMVERLADWQICRLELQADGVYDLVIDGEEPS